MFLFCCNEQVINLANKQIGKYFLFCKFHLFVIESWLCHLLMETNDIGLFEIIIPFDSIYIIFYLPIGILDKIYELQFSKWINKNIACV